MNVLNLCILQWWCMNCTILYCSDICISHNIFTSKTAFYITLVFSNFLVFTPKIHLLHQQLLCKPHVQYNNLQLFFFSVTVWPNVGHGLLILEVSRSHTTTHHSWWDSSGRVISSSQRPLPDNTQHSQQTNIHDPGGIRTHDLSRRAAADLHLRPHGYWDRQPILKYHLHLFSNNFVT